MLAVGEMAGGAVWPLVADHRACDLQWPGLLQCHARPRATNEGKVLLADLRSTLVQITHLKCTILIAILIENYIHLLIINVFSVVATLMLLRSSIIWFLCSADNKPCVSWMDGRHAHALSVARGVLRDLGLCLLHLTVTLVCIMAVHQMVTVYAF